MSVGAISLLVVMLAFVVAFVLAPLLFGFLVNRRWKAAIVTGIGLALSVIAAAVAGDFGVRHGHWNETIHANCVRDTPSGTRCP